MTERVGLDQEVDAQSVSYLSVTRMSTAYKVCPAVPIVPNRNFRSDRMFCRRGE